MSEPHPFRATIPPAPEGEPRPLWSVMIPTYNCAGYLRETLTSILAQDPGPGRMQIEVIDDHSTQDDPQAVVEELGQGRVEFYRQPQNVGKIENFATCLRRSRGYLVHLLHGDDYVLDGFYGKMERAFAEHPAIGAAFCRHVFMDEQGRWLWLSPEEQPESGVLSNWLERIVAEQPIQTPAMVVRRAVYERLGGFDRRLSHSIEDWEMWVRIAARYPVWYEVEVLAAYRTLLTPTTATGRVVFEGRNIRDARRSIEIFTAYLPAAIAPELVGKAKAWTVNWGLAITQRLLVAGDYHAAIVQARETLKFAPSLKVLGKLLNMFARSVVGRGLRQLRGAMSAPRAASP